MSLELPDAGVILVPVAVHDGIGQVFVTVVSAIGWSGSADSDFIPHGFAAAKVHIAQRGAAVKSTAVNLLHSSRNINIPQGDAALENFIIDLRNVFG